MALSVNTPPVVTGPVILSALEGASIRWINPTLNAYDPDLGDLLRVANIQPVLPPGVTWDPVFNVFVLDASDPAYDALRAGESITFTISYEVTDLTDYVPASIALTIVGVNDLAVVGGISTGTLTEDSVLSATGQLTVTDGDRDEAAFVVPAAPLQGSFGSLTLAADGSWSYLLNNGLAAVQALNDGESVTEVFTVSTIDGTRAQIAIDVLGQSECFITGTAGADVLTGTDLGEYFMGLGGRDRISGNGGGDTLDGGAGADSLYGGLGDDLVFYDANDRVQDGGAGLDTLSVSRSATINLGASDQVSGDSGATTGFEHVDGTYATASLALTGSAETNILFGGTAADRLTGGLGADVLVGNGGADRFIFRSLAETTGDEIGDFTHGVDRIDLSAIDAVAGGRDNGFAFIGGAAFSRAGQLRYDAATGLVQGDVNGDRVADFTLDIGAGLVITASDFVL